MQASDRNNASLWDMVQAIKLIQEFVTSLSYEDYLDSRRDQMAIERGLEILGEAARRISSEFQQDQIWAIVMVELPRLLAQLEPLVPDES
jgi:uncharacterized protein with HEPN domain